MRAKSSAGSSNPGLAGEACVVNTNLQQPVSSMGAEH